MPITGEQFLLHDTRGIPGTLEIQFLTREQASVALAGARDHSETVDWALQRRLLARIDSGLVPLATAEPDLIEEFEAEARRAAIGRSCGAEGVEAKTIAVSVRPRPDPIAR